MQINNSLTPIKVEIFPDNRMDTRNSALYLGLSVKTLAMYRSAGTSPPFAKMSNRVFYYKADLDQWLNSRGGFTSTAQARLSNGGENNE